MNGKADTKSHLNWPPQVTNAANKYIPFIIHSYTIVIPSRKGKKVVDSYGKSKNSCNNFFSFCFQFQFLNLQKLFTSCTCFKVFNV